MLRLYPRWNRRRFLQGGGLLGLLGALPGGRRLAAVVAARSGENSANVYTHLGLRPIINAAGTYTHLGGSLMPEEVVNAMIDAGKHYVPIRDLSQTIGARIAELTDNEAAMVTTGAAGAIFVATCAAIAGDDPDKRKRLPFTDGMKNEVVCQNLHRTGWVRQCEAAGARVISVEHKDEMERAITGKTAMLYYLVAEKHFGKYRDRLDAPGGKVSLEECIDIAKRTRLPLLIDAAAELPPHDNLTRYTKMGADLVAFSGGKGLRGPQNTGLLVGRKDLIENAKYFQSPYSGIGRDLKISKEALIGTLAAVERYVSTRSRERVESLESPGGPRPGRARRDRGRRNRLRPQVGDEPRPPLVGALARGKVALHLGRLLPGTAGGRAERRPATHTDGYHGRHLDARPRRGSDRRQAASGSAQESLPHGLGPRWHQQPERERLAARQSHRLVERLIGCAPQRGSGF